MREEYDRIEYGSVHIRLNGYPIGLNGGTLIGRSTLRGNQDVLRAWSDYNLCRMELKYTSTGEVFGPLSGFATVEDLAAFLATITPNDGVVYTDSWDIRVWDEVDPTIPPLHKVRGLNAAFSRVLPGRNKGNRQIYTFNNTVDPNRRWPRAQYAFALNELWRRAWGNPLEDDPAAWTDDHFRCFWISRNWRRFYQLLPAEALRILPFQNSNRRGYLSPGVFETSGPQEWFGQDIPGGTEPVVIGITSAGDLADVQALARVERRSGYFYANKYSYMVGYPIQDPVSGARAIMLRPLGMDNLYTNYFDPTRYELCALVHNADLDAHPLLAKISASDAERGFAPDVDQAGPWVRPTWGRKIRQISNPSRPSRDSRKLTRVRFFLRDLVTNKVSAYAQGEIRYGNSTKKYVGVYLMHGDPNF